MKFSIAWLKELCDFDLEPQELAARLTKVGLEVEAVSHSPTEWADVVVVEIAELSAHPNADKLKVVKVLDGEGTRTIVCGASGLKPGQRVPMAKPGAVIGGKTIAAAEVRGVESSGMLCSERELGISDDHSGLCALPVEWALGRRLSETPLADSYLDIGVTPNRPDALCHLGIAREIAAFTGGRVRRPRMTFREEGGEIGERLAVEITEQNACRRYVGRVVTSIKVGPSPLWMRARLAALGLRPINNVVDATNYAMLELGHPLHAFDLGRLAAVNKQRKLVVRRAGAAEEITTLDGKERKLVEEDLVIADGERAQAIAGVMGGANSEVTETTTEVVVESAYFEPAGVHRTSRRLELFTDAANRFWRGTDIDNLLFSNERVCQLLQENAGGKVCRGAVDVYPRRRTALEVQVRPKRVAAYLGIDVSAEDIAQKLTTLELTLKNRTGEGMTFGIPTFRQDLTSEVDLVEEVARLIGYDQIPETLPSLSGEYQSPATLANDLRDLRDQLVGFGMSEAVCYSFTSPAEESHFRPAHVKGAVALQNPMSIEESVMRTSLTPGLLRALKHNLSFQVRDVRLFELGRVFWPRNGEAVTFERDIALPTEHERLALLLAGPAAPFGWGMTSRVVDFFDLKRIVDWLLSTRRLPIRYEPLTTVPFLHPGASAKILIDVDGHSQEVGWMGALHPNTLDHFGIKEATFAAELDLRQLPLGARQVTYQQLPRFPSVRRDFAVVMSEAQPLGPMLDQLRAAQKTIAPQLEDVRLFDIYRGKPIPAGQHSVALALVFRHATRTLTDDEVQSQFSQLTELVKKTFGVEMRD